MFCLKKNFLFNRINEPFKNSIKEKIIPFILKTLTIKRPLDCNRIDFFLYAEAFAALVKFEFVSITGKRRKNYLNILYYFY